MKNFYSFHSVFMLLHFSINWKKTLASDLSILLSTNLVKSCKEGIARILNIHLCIFPNLINQCFFQVALSKELKAPVGSPAKGAVPHTPQLPPQSSHGLWHSRVMSSRSSGNPWLGPSGLGEAWGQQENEGCSPPCKQPQGMEWMCLSSVKWSDREREEGRNGRGRTDASPEWTSWP